MTAVLRRPKSPAYSADDLRREVSSRHFVEHLPHFLQRSDDRVERGIHAFDDLAEVAAMLAGVGAGRKLSGHGGFDQQVGVGDQGLQMCAHLFDGVVDEGFLAGKLLQRRFEVTAAELGDAGHGFFLDA